MTVENLEDLEVWQLSRTISKKIYSATKKEPFSKDFRFRDQIRASSGSVMDNIAEGFGRGGTKELLNFLSIARGSNEEVRSQIYRAYDFEYIDGSQFDDLMSFANSISRMLSSWINYLKKTDIKGNKYNSNEGEVEYRV